MPDAKNERCVSGQYRRLREHWVVPYNEFWYDRGNKVAGTKRTSLIVDLPDGRLPPLTPEGQKKAEARAVASRNDQLGNPLADSWEDRPLKERCLTGFNAGPPMQGLQTIMFNCSRLLDIL